ncbi:MAG TPA: hypothetical protein EYM96_02060, partial [Rhodospirillales bacterium]|nr:hypothetical protein [Rhodospirillales bacterium]
MKNITTTDVRISSAALYVALPTLLIVGLTGYLFGNNNQATASIEGNAYILQENETLKLQNVKLQEDFDNLFALKELSDANHLSNLNQFDESTIEVEEHVEPSYSLSAQNARPEAIFEFSDIPPAANERV